MWTEHNIMRTSRVTSRTPPLGVTVHGPAHRTRLPGWGRMIG